MTQARILVVEDDPVAAKDLAAALRKMGYEVPAVEHRGEAALDAAARTRPELVLMDVKVSGDLDGIEAARRITRELGVSVVYLSPDIDEETFGRARETDPYGYLVRPFTDRELRAAIELASHHHRAGRRRTGEEDAPVGEILRRYETIFRTSPVAMALARMSDGRLTEANESFVELSGWARRELVGRSLLALGWWARPADRARLQRTIREEGVARGLEVSLRTRAGELRDALVSAEPLELQGEQSLLMLFHDITERKQVERELEHLALHDPLTGLANRTLFLDRLNHAIGRAQREGGSVAVLFLDLDRFKMVNDSLGHPGGDDLLRSVAQRLLGCFREQDTLARLGGDEFAAVIERVEVEGEVRIVAERFSRALDPPFEVGGTRIRMSASIGIAVGRPPVSISPEELIRRADVAMYRAKRVNGTSYELFDPESAVGRRRYRLPGVGAPELPGHPRGPRRRGAQEGGR